MFFSLFGLGALSNNQYSARYGDEKDKYTSTQLSSTNNLIKSSCMRERRSFTMFNRRARPEHSVAISAAAQLQEGAGHLYNRYELHPIIIAIKNSGDTQFPENSHGFSLEHLISGDQSAPRSRTNNLGGSS